MSATKVKVAEKKKPRRIPPVPAAVSGLLAKQQVCDALGGCTPRYLDMMIKDGEFPEADSYLGRNPRWSVELFNEWCKDHRRTRQEA